MTLDKVSTFNKLIRDYKLHRGRYESLLQRIGNHSGKVLLSGAPECESLRVNLARLTHLDNGLRVLSKSDVNARNIVKMKQMLNDFVYYIDLAAQKTRHLIHSEDGPKI